jgi:uncharacterized phage-associated protein
MITPLCKKSVQAMNYLARKKDGQINKMKALKLIYFADRYHIRKYGRPVLGDQYWAMKLGPVASHTLNTAELNPGLEKDCLQYAKAFISHPKGDIKMLNILSKDKVDLKVFSQSDIEALETAYKEFGDRDQFELAEISHRYPEWLKHKKEIEVDKKRRVKMDYLDFFEDPKISSSDIFVLPREHLELAKISFLENKEAELVLG